MPIIICKECGKKKKHYAKGMCNPCYYRLRYIDNKDKILKQSKLWKKNNREKKRKYDRRYRKEHKQEITAYNKKYQSEHPEMSRTAANKYYRANKEKRHKKYREYYHANKDKEGKRHKKWASNNRDKANARNQRRRARQNGLPATLTHEEWQTTLDLFEHKCVYCGKDWDCKEHIIPVTKGGGYEYGNIVPACTSCNTSKKDRWIEDFCGEKRANQIRSAF